MLKRRIAPAFITLVWALAIHSALAQTEHFDRPIPMGVSISTTPSSPFIFAGTAGLLVRSVANPNAKFILSNNHVMGAVGPTLCPNTAPFGTWVLQQGTLDIGFDPGNDPFYVAGLKVAHVPIDFSLTANNLVDAAIAVTSPAFAKSEILNIGEPNPALGVAQPGMEVIKSGRTTGVTVGTVQAVNVTSFVVYGGSCGTNGTARFVGQISIAPSGGPFSAGGDSGAAILERSTGTPVGLLFAGGGGTTLANHMVFAYWSLGVVVDGLALDSEAAIGEQMSGVTADAALKRLMGIQARVQDRILRTPGVAGIGIGRAEGEDTPVFVIYTTRELPSQARASLGAGVEGVPVRFVQSGQFRAY